MTLFLEIRTKLRIKEVTVKNKTWDSSQHYDMDAELHRALQGQRGALSTESSVFVSSGTAKLHMTISSKVPMWNPHLVTDKSSCGKWSRHSQSGKQRLCLSCIPAWSSSFLVQIYSLSLFPHIWIHEGVLIDIQHSNSLSESELQQWGA